MKWIVETGNIELEVELPEGKKPNEPECENITSAAFRKAFEDRSRVPGLIIVMKPDGAGEDEQLLWAWDEKILRELGLDDNRLKDWLERLKAKREGLSVGPHSPTRLLKFDTGIWLGSSMKLVLGETEDEDKLEQSLVISDAEGGLLGEIGLSTLLVTLAEIGKLIEVDGYKLRQNPSPENTFIFEI